MPMSDPSTLDVTQTGARPLRSLAGVGAVAAVFIALVGVTDLVLSWGEWHAYEVVRDYVGGNAEAADLDAADRLSTVVSVVDLVLLAIGGIGFLRWLWLARLNTESLSQATHRHRRGWTIGGWFCPGANLFFPQMIVTDIWRTSRPDAARATEAKTLPRSPLVTWWWALFILSSLFMRYVVTVEIGEAASLDDLRNGARDLTAASVVRAVSVVLIVLIIKRVNDWQRTPRSPE
jgi:hypothetical protein